MGRYKDYREPKRRGYDDDNFVLDRATAGQQNLPSPSAAQASEPIDVVVKWFNTEKGFGFVALAGGSDVFMHIRHLEAAGHSSVPEGTRLKVRIGPGQRGPEVTELVEVDLSSAQVAKSSEPRLPISSQVVGKTEESIGTVKMYRADKGFGFVGQDNGGKDVFVHATALARAGLSGLVQGQRVRMQIGQGQKGLEAQAIKLLDQ